MNSYILFHSSNYAIWAESVIKDGGTECKLVGVPREISSDCGYCIEVLSEVKDTALKLLEEKHIPLDTVVDL